MKLFKTKEEKAKAREELWAKKEIIYVNEPGHFPCPDDTHPLFTIKVTKEKVGVCYYCSKVFSSQRRRWRLKYFLHKIKDQMMSTKQ